MPKIVSALSLPLWRNAHFPLEIAFLPTPLVGSIVRRSRIHDKQHYVGSILDHGVQRRELQSRTAGVLASIFECFQLLCRHRLACQVSQTRHRKLGSTAKSSGPFLGPRIRSKTVPSNWAAPVATAIGKTLHAAGFNLTVESECVFWALPLSSCI